MYERQINEKNAESAVTVPLTTYRNSISKPVLDMFLTACLVPVKSVKEITEEHLRLCAERRARVAPEENDLAK